MKEIFELNKNLFKVGDNYVCVSNELPKNGNYVYVPFNKRVWEYRVSPVPMPYWGNSETCKKIIFSTQFIHESIPVLNIEDEEMIGKPLENYVNEKHTQEECIGFIDGYQKAKETFKYTDEDLIRAIYLARFIETKESIKSIDNGKCAVYSHIDIEIIQSLQQPKEIKSIEVEYEFIEPNTYLNENDEIVEDYLYLPIVLPNGKIKCKINY